MAPRLAKTRKLGISWKQHMGIIDRECMSPQMIKNSRAECAGTYGYRSCTATICVLQNSENCPLIRVHFAA